MNNVVNKLWTSAQENEAEIWLGLGIGGFVATSVLVGRSTYLAMKDLKDLDEEIPRNEIVKRVWKYYIFPATTGVLSASCLIRSCVVSNRKIAAIAALATESALAETKAVNALNEYRKKVVEKLGADEEGAIHKEVVREQAEREYDELTVAETGHGRYLCYDAPSGRWYRSNTNFIETCANEVNRKLPNEMTVYLNEFYSLQGLEGIGMGKYMGFAVDQGYLELDIYGSRNVDGEPYSIINYTVYPVASPY